MSEKCPSNSWKHGERLCCCFLPYNHLRKHLPFFQLLSCQNRVPNPPAALCSCLLNISCQWANYYFSPSTYLEPVKGIYTKRKFFHIYSHSLLLSLRGTQKEMSVRMLMQLFSICSQWMGKDAAQLKKHNIIQLFPWLLCMRNSLQIRFRKREI